MKRCLALAFSLSLLSAMAAHASEIIQNGYTVRFEERIEDAPGTGLHGETVGRISIWRTGSQQLVWQENTNFRPGCGGIAAITRLNARFVALCGHLGGRHYTQKIIRLQNSSPKVITVDQYDDANPVRVEENGTLALDAWRRDMFPGELTGPRYFPFVYRMPDDGQALDFSLSFDEQAAQRYWLHYQAIRQTAPAAAVLPELLAALLASQAGKQPVCAELDRIEAELLREDPQAGQAGGRLQMQSWLRKLPAIGYPPLNTQACPGRI